MKTILTTAFCAVFSIAVGHADNNAKKSSAVDSSKVLPSFKSEVSANPSFVLQLVERAVRENPSFSREIVKTAIKATKADSKRVASIVEVVGVSVPDQLRIAAQCAVAVAPDSLKEVQAVLSKLDPGAKVAARDSANGGTDDDTDDDDDTGDETPNPLDFPASGKGIDVGFGKNAPGANGSGSSFFTSQFAQVASPATTKNQ